MHESNAAQVNITPEADELCHILAEAITRLIEDQDGESREKGLQCKR